MAQILRSALAEQRDLDATLIRKIAGQLVANYRNPLRLYYKLTTTEDENLGKVAAELKIEPIWLGLLKNYIESWNEDRKRVEYCTLVVE